MRATSFRAARAATVATAALACALTAAPAAHGVPTAQAVPGAAATSVVVGTPVVSGLLDDVIHGTSTHWADTPWVSAFTAVHVDPAPAVASVSAQWTLPDGTPWQTVQLTHDTGSGDWVYLPSAYGYADIPTQLGVWTITATALDASDQVVGTSQTQVTGRDPSTAVKPKLVLLAPVGRTTVKKRQTTHDYDGWWTSIKATVRFYDPDHVVGYAFIGDKVRKRAASSNWFGARTVRSGDYVQFTDDIPVRDVVGKHRLFVHVDYFRPSDYRWPSTFVRGVPATTVWKLRHWKNFRH
ncbi:MAG: hypothetical protein U0S36_15275 [Candidatus Nanopelagicales bacterium]